MGFRIARLIALLLISWIAMTFFHESGHLLGGLISGATLVDVDLAPWRMPYSLHAPDPTPLVTLWGGPLIGATIPLLLALWLKRQWIWFVADFCVLANGVYLLVAWVSGDALLDTARLLRAGASPLSIAAYCLVSISFGYHRFRQDCIRLLNPEQSPGVRPQSREEL